MRPTTASRAPRGRTKSAWLYAAGGAGAFALLFAVALYVGYGRWSGPSEALVEIEWPPNLDADGAAELLASRGLVSSARAMAYFLEATGGTAEFVPGPHLLGGGESPWDLKRCLERAPGRRTARIVVPEGYHRFDVAARLEKLCIASKRAFLTTSSDAAELEKLGLAKAAMSGVESAEGFLYPATYEFPIDADPRDVLTRLVAEADKRWQAITDGHKDGVASLAGTFGWGRREILTLASIVEKEAVVDEERPIIASVFLNRLTSPEFKSHKLQSDPTAMYGCVAAPDEAPSCAGYSGKASGAINNDTKNRYSTYSHAMLPPGPIANPGARSIEAVLAPAATKFFYFVAAGGGRHTFSETYEAHTEAVKKRAAAVAPK
jgi:UPF0755 protein